MVDPPVGYQPIGLKWVFKLKKDAAGRIVKHNAGLVAKRYVAGIDFDKVFAPVAHLDSVRFFYLHLLHRKVGRHIIWM